jgi:3-methylfumaryl-CoA hydratase
MPEPFSDWIGKTEELEELISLAPAYAAAATLDDTSTQFESGTPLPWLWHWFFFLTRAPQSRLSSDGHPERGGFMPPIELPRRMFAGARMRFLRPLVIGRTARRRAVIKDIVQKEGRAGRLAFVTVVQTIDQNAQICIEEEQDIVYRELGGPVSAPERRELPAVPEACWTRTIHPEPTLLFRFSALTFNAHRIHYDRTYATEVEGYPGLVVHGPLTAVLLMELVRFNTSRTVTAFGFRGHAPLFDLAPFRLIATLSDDHVDLEAQGPDGNTAMTARASLATPGSGAQRES